MQDRFPDLRALVAEINPGAPTHLGPSAVFDLNLLRGGAGGEQFDVEAQLGIRRGNDCPREFLKDFLEQLEVLKSGISSVTESIAKIKQLKRRAAEATNPEHEKIISDDLASVLKKSNEVVLKVKQGLQALREDNAAFISRNPNSSEGRMRENLYAAVTRRFREVLRVYQSVQLDYKKEVREKVARQVRIVFPEAPEEEVTRMVQEGDVATAAAIRLKVTGQCHESLQNTLADIQDKYRDIRRLEQNVSELHQLFVDLATLVDAQGELLDQIEFSVNSAKDYTEKAEKELISTRRNQLAAKKRMCWLSICTVILAVIIMMPVVVILAR